MKQMPPSELRTKAPFCDLFARAPGMVAAIAADMQANGYDESQPIVYWHGHCIVDGHTRQEAAQAAGVDVAVVMRDFTDEDAAVEYAIRRQVDRRQLTDAEIVRLRRELDKRRAANQHTRFATPVAKRSAEETADLLGTSRGKVEKARAIDDHASPDVKAAVERGDMSINAGYNRTMEDRRRLTPGPVEIVPPPAEPEMTDDDRQYESVFAGLSADEQRDWVKVQGQAYPDTLAGLRRFLSMREQAAADVPAETVTMPRREVATDWRSLLTQGLAAYQASDPTADDAKWLTDWAGDAYDAATATIERMIDGE